MKLLSLFAFILLLPFASRCQTVVMPQVGYSEDYTTVITKVEVNKGNTVVSFKSTIPAKGAWIQLNKSMYLQDAQGEERYNYIKSEGIPLMPEKLIAERDNQDVEFKVYFEKLKPGTKEINVIERARSANQQAQGIKYLNFYNVSLEKSRPSERVKVTDVVLSPPPVADTAYASSSDFTVKSGMADMGPMMSNVYTSMLDAQLKTYSDPAKISQVVKIIKTYYDALMKAGFSQDAALKIIIARPIISTDFTGK